MDILKNIEMSESKLASLVAKENSDKIFNNFASFANTNGSFNPNGMWAVKKRVFPKNPSSLPVAKKDVDCKIITSHQDLKNLYLDTFVHRLRYRPIREDYTVLITLKETLCEARIALSKLNKSPEWTADDLHKVLSSLKNNKSRDPHGLINKLFKPGVIGCNLFQSLLIMFNQIKIETVLPDFMHLSDIVAVYKGRGGRMELSSERGIFIVNLFRSILMKLVYKDKYDIVDSAM